MILTGQEIAEFVTEGKIDIDPFDPSKVGPNSYDLRLADTLIRYKRKFLDMTVENQTEEVPKNAEGGWYLQPGVLYLGNTIEWTGTDHFVPLIEGRSSVARLGIRVHATAGFGDVGFHGRWTLEIDCIQPVFLVPGVRICQIFYHTINDSKKDILYHKRVGSKYARSAHVQGSKIHLDPEVKEFGNMGGPPLHTDETG